MIPFKSNVRIFIIEFVCSVLLMTVYAVSTQGWESAAYVLMGLLPVLFMALIALKVNSEIIVIRCLYLSSIVVFGILSFIIHIQGILPFMFLAIGVTLALFLLPRILTEYFATTLVLLVVVAVIKGMDIDVTTDMRLYITYVMMYAFAFVALLFIIIGVERYKKEMEEKNEIAREALDAKSNFLANMSHEIRTPMNAIYGMAELLEKRDFGREEKEYIATIKSSSENLLSIINEILDFSKIDSGKMVIHEEPYDVCNLLQDVISIIRFRLREKNVVLDVRVDPRIPRMLIGDEVRIRQILLNLLNNAVKFTNRGKITLDMTWAPQDLDKGVLRIRVIDTGIGIAPENINKLFIAFGQLDTKKNRNVEGTGLGLAICKDLVDLMHGTISVSSVIKEGSTFFVNIQQKISDPQPCNYVPGNDDIYLPSEQFVIPFIAPKAKVLIVDDNKVNRQVARELMKLFGFDAYLAESGQEAIDKIEKNLVSYDIVFMDHMMPFMDGVEATRQIRALPGEYPKRVPIVALTANAIQGVEKQFLDAGMSDYLPKPIRIEHLALVLKRWIPKSKQFAPNLSPEQIAVLEANIDYSTLSREEILDRLDGVDTSAGIKNCAGSIDVYFDLLRTYSTSNLANNLTTFFEKEDLPNYAITAHSIKGASRNIGAHDIADKAYSLERAGNRGDITYIWDNHQDLLDEYTELIKLLKKIFFGNLGK